MEGYIDMHSHILPEVDDGARDPDEMKEMLCIAYEEGIRCIIATPHYHPRRGHASPERLKEQLALLRREAHAIDEKFRIYLGTEIYFGQEVVEKLRNGRIMSMNGRNYVLVEFSPSDPSDYICQSAQKLQVNGYEVIIAHVERYASLVSDMKQIYRLHEMGVHLQVNAGSIIGEIGWKTKKFIKKLMKEDLVFCVGTDAHRSDSRQPRMREAAEYVAKKYGEEYMRQIFFSNAKKMLRKVDR